MSSPTIYAVLTGDLVKSRRMDDLEGVREDLLAALDEVRGWRRGLLKGRPEFFRGDAWQALLADPGAALRVAVMVRASLLASGRADTRLAIGLGTADRISSKRISLSTGEAFELSGHALDEMSTNQLMTVAAPAGLGVLGEWLPVVAGLCSAHMDLWTARQAEVATWAAGPDDLTHEQVAEQLGISRQAVQKSLDSACWPAVRNAIECFEQADWPTLLDGSQPKTVAFRKAT